LIRLSDELVEVVQSNRLNFSSADRFHAVLKSTRELKANPVGSTGRIYLIVDELYGDDVTTEEAFQHKVSNIYNRQIKYPFDANEIDFKRIKVQSSDTDSKNAKEVLYILLAVISNLEGRNGRLMEPYLYGRLALNQLTSPPSVYYHVSGWN